MKALLDRRGFLIPAGVSLVAAAIAVLPAEGLDLCWARREDADEEADNEMDRWLQLIFVVALLVSAGAASLMLMKNRAQAAVIGIGALMSYAIRLGLHIGVVTPVGKLLPAGCSTTKGISGHAFFFMFHVLLWAGAYFELCQERKAGSPRARAHTVQHRKAHGRKPGTQVTAEELFAFIQVVAFLTAAVVAYLALSTTYQHGYHSARHMLYGVVAAGVAATATLGAAVVALPLVEDRLGKAR